jgi:hypothetical protein
MQHTFCLFRRTSLHCIVYLKKNFILITDIKSYAILSNVFACFITILFRYVKMIHCPRLSAVIVWTNWKVFMTFGSPV